MVASTLQLTVRQKLITGFSHERDQVYSTDQQKHLAS